MTRSSLPTGMLMALLLAKPVLAAKLSLYTESYPPFSYEEEGHVVGGLSTEIVRALMDRAGLAFSIELVPWARALQSAERQHDACVFSARRTADRETRFTWIGPLVSDPLALFGKADLTFKLRTLTDARKYRVGSYNGASAIQYLEEAFVHAELAPDDKLNPRKLEAGHIDLWAASERHGRYVANSVGVTDIRSVLIINHGVQSQMYLAFHREMPPALVDRLNTLLRTMSSGGTLARIDARYR